MPTETVYGIAALASSVSAVRETFRVKGRPADNPLIVHLASLSQVEEVVSSFSSVAQKLAAAFWPGPLTLVLPKLASVPDEVTAGLATVAVRVPAHPVALRLIHAAGGPLSAPSANRFMSLSPTRAEDIDPLVGDLLSLVLDGGPCSVGIESTVADCSEEGVAILRPGGVPREAIEAIVGGLRPSESVERRSPGLYVRHYAPRTPIRLVEGEFSGPGLHLGSSEPVEYAVRLYAELHRLDELGLAEILVQSPPDGPDWEAVWDRLQKATSGHRQV